MVTESVICGKLPGGAVIVRTPPPGMLNAIVSRSVLLGSPLTWACSWAVSDDTKSVRLLMRSASRNVSTVFRELASSAELTMIVAEGARRDSSGSRAGRKKGLRRPGLAGARPKRAFKYFSQEFVNMIVVSF